MSKLCGKLKHVSADMERAEKYGYWTGLYELAPLDEWTGWWIFQSRLYMFVNHPDHPLTFHHPDGYSIRPDNRFKTDMGSVPIPLQTFAPTIFAKDKWLRAYILHDSAYAHGGLWYAKHDMHKFVFAEISRKDADNLLSLGIKASGGNFMRSGPIWLGVRLGGFRHFGKGDLRKQEK